MVKDGEITNISDALNQGLPLREPEIVDILLPDLDDEVLDVNMVQRMTDSGRRVKFAITTVVGNKDGYVGLGHSKGKEVGPAIRKAIDNAKVNIMEIKRGCGSWECGCGTPHSLPFRVVGKSGSVEVTLKPAPRGVSLAVGDVAKHVLRVAGIKDAWGFTKGHTKTTVNYAIATFNALKVTSALKVTEGQKLTLKILSGAQPVEDFIGEEEEAPSEDAPEGADVPSAEAAPEKGEEPPAAESPKEGEAPPAKEAPEKAEAPPAKEAPEKAEVPPAKETPEKAEAPPAKEAPEKAEAPPSKETPEKVETPPEEVEKGEPDNSEKKSEQPKSQKKVEDK
ncbi:MAG: 30S ribosomal protein S5 [Thermoplasmata archaeon]|nr:30S ribosomal protein S5 [Thermoplasmata archaeon]